MDYKLNTPGLKKFTAEREKERELQAEQSPALVEWDSMLGIIREGGQLLTNWLVLDISNLCLPMGQNKFSIYPTT